MAASFPEITIPSDITGSPFPVVVEKGAELYRIQQKVKQVLDATTGSTAASIAQFASWADDDIPVTAATIAGIHNHYLFDGWINTCRKVMDKWVGVGALTDAPSIYSVSPVTGDEAGGTTVTIIGNALGLATGVLFGASAGTSFTVVNATTITVVTPAGSVGAVNVTVQHPNGNVVRASGFTYTGS